MVDLPSPWQPPFTRKAFKAFDDASRAQLCEPDFGAPHLTLFMVVRAFLRLGVLAPRCLVSKQFPQRSITPCIPMPSQSSELCDSDHPEIQAAARDIVDPQATGRQAADSIRQFVRNQVRYVLRPKEWRASQVLLAREGMCTNKAMLQVALCRAAGLPAGFVITHLTKQVYAVDPDFDRELLDRIHEPTVHCFAAVWIPEEAAFRLYDATEEERPGSPFLSPSSPAAAPTQGVRRTPGPPAASGGLRSNPDAGGDTAGGYLTTMLELPATGETRFQARWLAGPFSPVQSNIDALLLRVPYRNNKGAGLERQNARFRGLSASSKAQDERAAWKRTRVVLASLIAVAAAACVGYMASPTAKGRGAA